MPAGLGVRRPPVLGLVALRGRSDTLVSSHPARLPEPPAVRVPRPTLGRRAQVTASGTAGCAVTTRGLKAPLGALPRESNTWAQHSLNAAGTCHFDTSRKEHVSDETAQTPSFGQRVPATRGTTANTAGCACPGHDFRYCRLCRDPRHFRNGVSEHVFDQPTQDALVQPEGPSDVE